MRIKDLRKEHLQDRVRAVASVTWEDSERPDFELYFATDNGFEKDLGCDPHAFLVAAVMPAFCGEEKRIEIEARVDPEIRHGLLTAMRWIRQWWYRPDKPMLRIEDRGDALPAGRIDPGRTGMYFSGGVDSLASLRANRLNFAMDHPVSVKDGLLVYGLEVEDPRVFEIVLHSINLLAEAAELNLIPVYTNIRDLNPDWMFWEKVFHDAVFGAIAHAFSARFATVCIAATYDIPNIQPSGTHPLLDLCYSSRNLRIQHDGITMSRLDKLRLISDWEFGFQHIRTCNESDLYRPEQLNCGRCRKCITTMLALMALGKLDKTNAFPKTDISPEFLKSNFEVYKTTACWWEEVVQPLREQGYADLAHVIEKKLDAFYRQREKNDLHKAIVAKAKRLDQKYLHGRMHEIKHSIHMRH